MLDPTLTDIALVRFKTITDFPYFQAIVFGLIGVEMIDHPEIKTLAVDKHMRLYYNPDFLKKITLEEGVGVLVHEINHLLREHHARGEHHDPLLFNMAGDLEINDDITRDANCGVKLPADLLHPSQYKFPEDQIAEWYYNELVKQAKKINICVVGNPGSGSGCGSISNGNSKDYELPYDGTSNNGHSEKMVDFYRKQTAEAVQDHVKNRGTIPGYLDRWASKFLKPKVDWKKELRAAITNSLNAITSGMSDYARTKPSRRQSSNKDFVLPAFIQPVPKVAIIIDTSGSMSGDFIDQAVGEVSGVLQNAASDVIIVDVDAQVNHIGTIRDKKQLKLAGGGGTDLREGFKALRKYKTKPNLIITLSDGYTPWEEEPIPHTKNIICLLSQGSEKDDKRGAPSWAKVLFVEVGDQK